MDPADRFQLIEMTAMQTALAAVLTQIPGGLAGFEINMLQRIEFWSRAAESAEAQAALDANTLAEALDRIMNEVLATHREMKPPRQRR